MGSLSRSFEHWARHAALRDIAPSRATQSMVERDRIRALHDGFQEITDALSHLAWVQRETTDMQLGAQHRVIQLQKTANTTLARVSSQLDEIAEVLRSINDANLENLKLVRAERALKEALFQLSTMLEDMIDPDDPIARLALSQRALDILDQHGLGTAHLSDLDDKRAFATFVKTTRKTIRDTPPEEQADLLAFEAWRKAYAEATQSIFPAFVPAAAPPFEPGKEPVWQATPGPTWQDREPPRPALKVLRPRPAERTHPGDHPISSDFYPLPQTVWDGTSVVGYPYGGVLPGSLDPADVPSEAETNRRLPVSGRGVMQFLDSVFDADAWANARRFEQALRDWAAAVRAHEACCHDIAAWHAEEAAVAAENSRRQAEMPGRLAAFRLAEEARRRDYEAARAEHVKDESRRRTEHDAAVSRHQEQERQRHARWRQAAEEHERRETARRERWEADLAEVVAALQGQGQAINAFLEEHPDLQLLHDKVAWEKDVDDFRSLARLQTTKLRLRAILKAKGPQPAQPAPRAAEPGADA